MEGSSQAAGTLRRPARWTDFPPGPGMFPASSCRCCPWHPAELTQGWGTPWRSWGGNSRRDFPHRFGHQHWIRQCWWGHSTGHVPIPPVSQPRGRQSSGAGAEGPRASSKQMQERHSPAAVTNIWPQQTPGNPQCRRPAPQRCRQPPAPCRRAMGMSSFPGGVPEMSLKMPKSYLAPRRSEGRREPGEPAAAPPWLPTPQLLRSRLRARPPRRSI